MVCRFECFSRSGSSELFHAGWLSANDLFRAQEQPDNSYQALQIHSIYINYDKDKPTFTLRILYNSANEALDHSPVVLPNKRVTHL